MFNFIRRWIRNRQQNIYAYWDGQRNRRADPLTVWRAFQNDPKFIPDRDIEFIRAGQIENSPIEIKVVDEAWQNCVNATRMALDLPTFEQGGLTETQVYLLFQSFVLYIAGLKKSFNDLQTFALAMGPLPLSSTVLEQAPTITKPTADYSSTCADLSCDAPPVLLRELSELSTSTPESSEP